MDFLDIIKSFTDRDVSAFNDFKFRFGAEISTVYIFLIVALFALFIYITWRNAKELKSRAKRVMLMAFRAIALTFVFLIIFQPKLELRETKKIKSAMAVLIDDSLSMSLKKEGSDKLSRSESLKRFIVKNDDYFDDLNNDFDVDFYTFGSTVKKTSLEEISTREDPSQPETNIGEAIEGLKNINPNVEYKDVMLFTDGNDNGKIASLAGNMKTELDRSLFEKYVKSLNVNIHPVSCEGDDEGFSDLAIKKIVSDKFGFIRTPFEIEVNIYASGIETKNIPITLKEGDSIIKTKNLMLKKGKSEYKTKIKFYPQKIGRKVYTVSLPTYSDELIQVNNEMSFFVHIIRDKTRVLYVVGKPTWDERFLRRALKTDPNIDLITFMILRTSYDYINVPENEMSLIPFPTKEIFDKELHTFDVVIFLNFNYGPYVSPLYLKNIQRYVTEDGGGFVMVGGDRSFSAGGYNRTVIKDILPIEMTIGRERYPYKFGKFKPVLTEVGNTHPILRMDFDEEKNREMYEVLPPLEGINSVLKLKYDAVALMNHPKEKNEHGPAPIIAISEVGKGRSMAITTDTLWKWNFPYVGEGGSPRIYDNFWHNAIKWLVKDPDLDLVKLSLPDNTFAVNEKIGVKLKVLSHKYKPTDKAKIQAEVKSADNKVKKLLFKRTDVPGEYQSEFTPDSDGNYVIEASARIDDKYLGKDIYPIIVEDPKEEYSDLEVNYELLKELSRITGTDTQTLKGGELKGELNADRSKEELLLGKIELNFWDSKTNFIIILMFLIMEWYFRRRYGLY
jgi:uncharacterized membrane protein